ncbi:uncharacterized protein LOC143275520 [Babylonia areolata]|uniref:uncharacterized protein LOC143275520 n=1 Tax=Babylonia areolata TaxID=304850 RepID=UPI003FD0B192
MDHMASQGQPQGSEVKIEIDIAEEPKAQWMAAGSTSSQPEYRGNKSDALHQTDAARASALVFKFEPLEQAHNPQGFNYAAVSNNIVPRISDIKNPPTEHVDKDIRTELVNLCMTPGFAGMKTEPLVQVDAFRGVCIQPGNQCLNPWGVSIVKPESHQQTNTCPGISTTPLIQNIQGNASHHFQPEPTEQHWNVRYGSQVCVDLSAEPVNLSTAWNSDRTENFVSVSHIARMKCEQYSSVQSYVPCNTNAGIKPEPFTKNLSADSHRVIASSDMQSGDIRKDVSIAWKSERPNPFTAGAVRDSINEPCSAASGSTDILTGGLMTDVMLVAGNKNTVHAQSVSHMYGEVVKPLCDEQKCDEASSGADMPRFHQSVDSRPPVDRAPGSLSCDICCKTFKRASNLKMHRMSHTGEKPFACDVCDKAFQSSYHLKTHKMIHSGEKPFGCNICSKVFSQASQLKNHKVVHTGRRPFTCDVCNKSFTRSFNLKVHKMIHTGEKPFECDVCRKVFMRATHLSNHKLTHGGEKPFVCDVCCKTFSRAGNLKTHKKIHTGEKPFVCEICSKEFTQGAHLKVHKMIHASSKPFVCDICGKGFTYATNLKIHKKVHTGHESFPCDICQKTFICENRLKQHQTTHSERHFACDVCGKKFKQLPHLKTHEAIHTGEKPFMCDLCGKTFAQAGNLRKHRATHTDKDLPGCFECDMCSEKFKWASELKNHKIIHIIHDVDP